MSLVVVGSKDNLLRVSDLSEGMSATKCAYLLKVSRNSDRNGEMYLNFHFRTVDGSMVIGRKFRVTADNTIGNEMMMVQRSVVNVSFLTQIYRGSYVLLVDSIEFASGVSSEVFFDDYRLADDAYDYLLTRSEELGMKAPSETLKRVSLLSVMSGKQGGILFVLKSVLTSLSSLEEELSASDYNQLVSVIMCVISPYVYYCRALDKLGFVDKVFQLKCLSDLDWVKDESLKAIGVDTLSAMIGLARPEHWMAHVICKTFDLIMYQMNVLDRVKASPNNTVISFGEDRIIKF